MTTTPASIDDPAALARSPVTNHFDGSWFHPSPGHEEALARLHYVVEQHLRVGVLLGEAGSGKSLLLSKLADDWASHETHVVRMSLLGSDADEFLLELATGLHANPRLDASPAALWRAIRDALKAYKYQQHTTLVLLDDAHEAPPETLAAVCRLAEVDAAETHAAEEAPLTIVAAAQTDAVARLPKRLLDRAGLRIDVEPWEKEDTLEFLSRAVEQLRAMDAADAAEDEAPREVFTAEAIEKLHELSGGIPRCVSQLAQWALLAGAGLGLEQIDDETVESASEELGVRAIVRSPQR